MGKIKALKGLGKAFLEEKIVRSKISPLDIKSGKKKKILTANRGAMRIAEINKEIRNAHRYARQGLSEDYAQEVSDIYAGKWKSKK